MKNDLRIFVNIVAAITFIVMAIAYMVEIATRTTPHQQAMFNMAVASCVKQGGSPAFLGGEPWKCDFPVAKPCVIDEAEDEFPEIDPSRTLEARR